MQVFISWSGERSRMLARMLSDWLRLVIQHARPWMSDADLDLGKRWSQELAHRLAEADFGIACVTPENVTSPWLLFEAGALAKSVQDGRLIPLLLGVPHTELSPPLSQFQAIEVTKDGLIRLVLAIADALPAGAVSSETATQAFEMAWPLLVKQLDSLPKHPTEVKPLDMETLLGEILTVVRRLDQTFVKAIDSTSSMNTAIVFEWLKSQLLSAEEELVRHDYILRFYNERAAVVPQTLEDRHQELRSRRQFISQALDAIVALEQISCPDPRRL